MSTLLLRLAGPMQSWGTQSRFRNRDTGQEPSKSGVIGLLSAALGRPRSAPVTDLAALRMGVRVEREGVMQRDYHTAGGTHRRGDPYGVPTADGRSVGPVTSSRYYLADADFLVGLEGDPELLARIDRALAAPVWQLFLGRKSFVPGVPVRLPEAPPQGPGLRPGPLEETLSTYPWFRDDARAGRDRPSSLRLVLETEPGDGEEARHDVPLDFERRLFGVRHVRTAWAKPPAVEEEPCTSPA